MEVDAADCVLDARGRVLCPVCVEAQVGGGREGGEAEYSLPDDTSRTVLAVNEGRLGGRPHLLGSREGAP
jgi:hypothetical protein